MTVASCFLVLLKPVNAKLDVHACVQPQQQHAACHFVHRKDTFVTPANK
jgi:hypothetical protein